MTIEVRKAPILTAEEVKEATIEGLTELGFTDFMKGDWTLTAEALEEQVNDNVEIGTRMVAELSDWNGLGGLCKDNFDEVLGNWIEEQVDCLYLNN